MKKVKDFNDFLIDLIFEDNAPKGHGVTELPFVISDKLRKMLQSINHIIATRILELDKSRKEEKVTFVDLDEEKDNYFSLVNSNKAYDNILNQYSHQVKNLDKEQAAKSMVTITPGPDTYLQDFWTKNRSSIRIGSFINKVFPKEFISGGKPGEDIESFVQAIVAKRQKIQEPKERFKLVEGDDIITYYDESMYDIKDEDDDIIDSAPLQKSCMRHSGCASYIEFYAENNVKLLILFSDVEGREELIVGRALVWELAQPSGRTFMDRIYYRYESDMAMFKQYADSKGWLYKSSQNMEATTPIVDPLRHGHISTMLLKTKRGFVEANSRKYPYIDTMKWFYIDYGYLSNIEPTNNDEKVYKLTDTGGEYEEVFPEEQGTYIDFYGEWFDEDDITYCELGSDWRTNADAIYIEQYGQYATERWLERNMEWSDYEDRYLRTDDAIWSNYHNDYIDGNNLISMSTGADGDSIEYVKETDDYRSENEVNNSVIDYIVDDYIYYFDKSDYGDNFVFTRTSNTFMSEWGYKHIVWDKDKLFKYKGKWHYEYDNLMKDELIGQKRINFDE